MIDILEISFAGNFLLSLVIFYQITYCVEKLPALRKQICAVLYGFPLYIFPNQEIRKSGRKNWGFWCFEKNRQKEKDFKEKDFKEKDFWCYEGP